eukprot:768628-Hanusia_phi.AAC.5
MAADRLVGGAAEGWRVPDSHKSDCGCHVDLSGRYRTAEEKEDDLVLARRTECGEPESRSGMSAPSRSQQSNGRSAQQDLEPRVYIVDADRTPHLPVGVGGRAVQVEVCSLDG